MRSWVGKLNNGRHVGFVMGMKCGVMLFPKEHRFLRNRVPLFTVFGVAVFTFSIVQIIVIGAV